MAAGDTNVRITRGYDDSPTRFSGLRDLCRSASSPEEPVLIEALVLGVVAFASTNIDDALVLLAFFSDSKLRAAHIVVGQYLGMAALFIAALTLALIALAIPSGYIGFMGFLSFLIGLKRLWSVWRKRENGA